MGFELYSKYGYAHLKRLERDGDVPSLLGALEAPRIKKSARRRAAVVSSLRRVQAVGAVPKISELLVDDHGEVVRRMAAITLGELGDPSALPALRVALGDSSDRVQLWATQGLGRLGDRDSVESLILRLQDEDWRFRSYAATALGEIGDFRAIEPLRLRLEDPSRTVRLSIRKALEELGEWE